MGQKAGSLQGGPNVGRHKTLKATIMIYSQNQRKLCLKNESKMTLLHQAENINRDRNYLKRAK